MQEPLAGHFGNSPARPPRRRVFRLFLAVGLAALTHCSRDAAERRASIYDLKADPTEQNVATIRAMLDDDDRDVRATALHALATLGVEDAAELAAADLEDPDGFVRATAAKLLEDRGDERHVGPLAAVLARDPDPIARQRAAEALAGLGGDGAVRALASGLSDPMEKVRLAAVEGLRRLDPSFARTELARLLADDPSWEIRARAARVLGLAGGAEARAALRAAAEDPNEFVRSAASNALRGVPPTGASPGAEP